MIYFIYFLKKSKAKIEKKKKKLQSKGAQRYSLPKDEPFSVLISFVLAETQRGNFPSF